MPRPDALSRRGFSLIELLTVVAVIGILAALLIPSLSAVRVAAARARTKVRFNQWAAAIEAFRREYGCYPEFDPSATVNGGAAGAGDHLFHDVLAGRRRDGSALGAAAAAQNRKRIPFHAFAEGEFADAAAPVPQLLQDASGQTAIAVLVDRNLDGRIDGSDYAAFPAVAGLMPSADDVPPGGLRLAVAFYAPAPGADVAHPAFVFSWK